MIQEVLEFVNNNINVASFAASLATFVTAILAYSTLREMARQRRIGYLPDVGLKNLEMSISFGQARSTPEHPDNRMFTFMPNEIELQNIGQGVAKSVGIVSEFDIEQAIQLIKQYDQDKIFELSLNDYFLLLRSEKLKLYYEFMSPDIYSTNFILSHEEVTISIPYRYIILYIIYLYLLSRQNSFAPYSEPLFEFSSLTYTITYEDIEGKTYTKKVKAICHLLNFQAIHLEKDGSLGNFHISFQ